MPERLCANNELCVDWLWKYGLPSLNGAVLIVRAAG